MDHAAEDRVRRLAAGLRDLQREAALRHSPVEPVSGCQSLLDALDDLLNGKRLPIRRWLGLAASRPGAPGRSVDQKRKVLTMIDELQAGGMSLDEAAVAAGADQRSVSRWRKEPRWIAEAVAERLDATPDSGDSSKD